MSVSITEEWINQIKTVIGYPTVNKVFLTDDQIRTYIVATVLREYFTKFPIEVTDQQSISSSPSELEIDFPDENTFGVTSLAVVGKLGGTSGGTSSFYDLVRFQQMGSTELGGSYGIKGFNPNSLQQTYLDRIQQVGSVQNALGSNDFRVYTAERKIVVHTDQTGFVLMTWAKLSTNFEDVLFERKQDVIDLSKANLLMHLVNTEGLINEPTMDIGELRSKAEELRNPIVEEWKEIPDVILLRQT